MSTSHIKGLTLLAATFVAGAALLSCSNEDGGHDATGSSSKTLSTSGNVLVIVIDDCGWEDLSPSLTPYLHSLGKDAGRSFSRFYSSPSCSPSRYMLHFGVLPHRRFLGSAIDVGKAYGHGAGNKDTTVATHLAEFGISTGAFGKWHASDRGGSSEHPGPREFGYETWRAGHLGNLPMKGSHVNWVRTDDGVSRECTTYSTVAIRDALLDWWKLVQGRRFAVCSFLAPHEPFSHAHHSGLLRGDMTFTPNSRGRYESALAAIDHAIEQIVAEVDLQSTTVLIVSDNGTPLECKPPQGREVNYKATVYEGGIRVPLFALGAGVITGRSDQLVQIVDIPSTIIELMTGASAPEMSDSISFEDVLNGGPSQREYVWVQKFLPNGGRRPNLRQNNWAIVHKDGLKLRYQDDTLSLIDLFNSPHEGTELDILASGHAADARALLDEARHILGDGWRYPLLSSDAPKWSRSVLEDR